MLIELWSSSIYLGVPRLLGCLGCWSFTAEGGFSRGKESSVSAASLQRGSHGYRSWALLLGSPAIECGCR